MYTYNKDEIKQNLTTAQVHELLTEFGGEPYEKGDTIISKTICHCGQSHKLYYYPNTTLFRCYTDCGGTFDIFELTQKVLSREQPKQREDPEWNLPECIDYVARKFGFSPNEQNFDEVSQISQDLKILENYDRIKDININNQEVELKEYDNKVLKYLPHPIIAPWEREGITREVINDAGICFDPQSSGIVIPHYDINDRLVGIRERALVQEDAEMYGKYRPAYIGRQMFNHPLGFNLYNLNHSKNNIQAIKKAFVFEGEKSCLLYRSYFGEENDISVAICGSSFINYQAWLLINQGVQEIIVALDKQFREKGDKEFEKLTKNLRQIHTKYGKFVNLSIMFDKHDMLGYKMSPIDCGPDVFMELYKNRINLYE